MKKIKLFLTLTVIISSFGLTAQVAINSDGSTPASSAMLDVQSTTKGFLPPCMTITQRNTISDPATGLMVYNTTTKRPNIYNGSEWKTLDGTWENCGNQISYNGQTYNTVLIGDQCWMAENLNVGTMINSNTGGTNGDGQQTDNGTIEKYCYDNNASNCNTYGGLYQWNELMQYVTTSGTQGICPPNWHIPTDAEWKTLEGTVDTQYGVGSPEWNNTYFRGFDAGKRLKTTNGWNTNTGTDAFGFSALPGGYVSTDGNSCSSGSYGFWWTSDPYYTVNGWMRYLKESKDQVYRFYYGAEAQALSVRCIKD